MLLRSGYKIEGNDSLIFGLEDASHIDGPKAKITHQDGCNRFTCQGTVRQAQGGGELNRFGNFFNGQIAGDGEVEILAFLVRGQAGLRCWWGQKLP